MVVDKLGNERACILLGNLGKGETLASKWTMKERLVNEDVGSWCHTFQHALVSIPLCQHTLVTYLYANTHW